MSTAELATSYAALILADDGVEITADKLQSIISAAKVNVESIWTTLFAKALEGKDVKDMLMNTGSGAAAPAAAAAAPAAGGAAPAATDAAPAAEEKKKKQEEKEESDEDMGFGLFD